MLTASEKKLAWPCSSGLLGSRRNFKQNFGQTVLFKRENDYFYCSCSWSGSMLMFIMCYNRSETRLYSQSAISYLFPKHLRLRSWPRTPQHHMFTCAGQVGAVLFLLWQGGQKSEFYYTRVPCKCHVSCRFVWVGVNILQGLIFQNVNVNKTMQRDFKCLCVCIFFCFGGKQRVRRGGEPQTMMFSHNIDSV